MIINILALHMYNCYGEPGPTLSSTVVDVVLNEALSSFSTQLPTHVSCMYVMYIYNYVCTIIIYMFNSFYRFVQSIDCVTKSVVQYVIECVIMDISLLYRSWIYHCFVWDMTALDQFPIPFTSL